jgi:WD40 repeat protein
MPIIIKKKFIPWLLFLLLLLAITGTYYLINYRTTSGIVDMLSISSDGHYVISADEKEYIVLWDLQTHTKKIIARKAHIWAAYFIPNTHDYIWQDQKMVLHVANVEHGPIKTVFLNFYSYGLTMTPDHRYFMSGDIAEGLHWCEDQTCKILIKPWSDDPKEFISDMPFVLTLLPDGIHVIESKMSAVNDDPKDSSGVYLWNIQTGKWHHDYIGNMVQTFATISPDGKYVVAGDMNGGNLFVWDLKTGKQKIASWGNEPVIGYTKNGVITDPHQIIPPKDFYHYYNILSVKFIDGEHYLVFLNQCHYALLYQTLNSKPLKYLDLGTDPWPAIFNLERDQSMDTSPSAHILVIAKDQEPGIMVYQYDPSKQTLTKVWDAK